MKNLPLSMADSVRNRTGMIRKAVLTAIFISTLLLGGVHLGGTVNAATSPFYVAPNGADNTTSGSSSAPFKTINYALSKATPGTTIIVKEGTYNEKIHTVVNGTLTSPITLQTQGKVRLVGTSEGKILAIKHSYYIVKGFDFDGSVYNKDELMEVDKGSYNVIQNNYFHNASDECIQIEDLSRGNKILNNQFVNCHKNTKPVMLVKDTSVQGTTCGNKNDKGILLSPALFSNVNLKNPDCTAVTTITPIATKVPSVTPISPVATKVPTATPTKIVTPIVTKVPTTAPTKTIAPSPTKVPTQPPAPSTGLFSLKNWKLTLPIGSSGDPTEIKQPELSNGYRIDPYFVTASTGNGYRFRAPVNGVTTSGSSYPRSELRELTSSGSNASWSSGYGTHTMTLDEAITKVPFVKKHVVAGQIHDSGDDVIVIRLEDKKLFVDINGADGPTLNANYVLGTRFTVKFEVSNNQTKIYYNNALAHTLNQSYSGAYFKAGAYTQSNCDRETNCSSSNYGEVVIYNATVTHQ